MKKGYSSPYSIEIFKGKSGLLQIYTIWEGINSRNPETNIAHLPGWYLSFFNTIDKFDSDIYFILVLKESSPLFILPLKHTFKKYFIIKTPVLELPIHGHFYYRDFITADQTFGTEDINSILYLIKKKFPKSWDILIGLNIYECSNFYNLFSAANFKFKFINRYGRIDYLFINKGVDAESLFSRNMRKKLKKYKRKIEEGSSLYFETERLFNGENELFKRFLELENSGWKGSAGENTSIKSHITLVNLYKDFIKNINSEAYFLIIIGRLDDIDIVGDLGFIYKNTFYSLKIAYNENYSHLSPGQLLQEYEIKLIYNHPEINYINFMTGFETHKLWTDKFIPTYNAMIFRSSLKGLFLGFIFNLKKYLK